MGLQSQDMSVFLGKPAVQHQPKVTQYPAKSVNHLVESYQYKLIHAAEELV